MGLSTGLVGKNPSWGWESGWSNTLKVVMGTRCLPSPMAASLLPRSRSLSRIRMEM